MSNLTVKLWVFPRKDFRAWSRLVGNDAGKIASHAAYMAMIAGLQADQERQGIVVERVGMRVAEMESMLAEANLPNTPDGRATVIAAWPTMKLLKEWHFDFGLYAADGQPVSELACDELLEAIINWAVRRGYLIGGGFGPPEST